MIKSFKVLILGDAGVGKTTSVTRYVGGEFFPAKSTIGVDFLIKNVKIKIKGSKDLRAVLQLWDFSGETQFREILPYYAQGTNGLIFMFDSTRMDTLINLGDWFNRITKYVPLNCPKVLASCKHDLPESDINQDLLQSHMSQYQYNDYLVTSGITGLNIDQIYKKISHLIAKNMNPED